MATPTDPPIHEMTDAQLAEDIDFLRSQITDWQTQITDLTLIVNDQRAAYRLAVHEWDEGAMTDMDSDAEDLRRLRKTLREDQEELGALLEEQARRAR